jgi:hypothetical protein
VDFSELLTIFKEFPASGRTGGAAQHYRTDCLRRLPRCKALSLSERKTVVRIRFFMEGIHLRDEIDIKLKRRQMPLCRALVCRGQLAFVSPFL